MFEAATTVDKDDCAREPIHSPGAIQPHGYLVILNVADHSVVAVSRNFAEALDLSPDDVVGRAAGDFLVSTTTETLDRMLDRVERDLPVWVAMRHPTRSDHLEGIVRADGGLLLLELEPATPAELAATLFSEVRGSIERIRHSRSTERACHALAAAVRRQSGFDRVMVYRFDGDFNGQVIAEDRGAGVQSYLGHAFPASDIPAQARALYLRNTFRIIPDTRYRPSPITPSLHPTSGRPFDLSDVTLRSVSPVHLEYLRNMGVAASMSISIIRDNRLWGLVACHHAGPRALPQSVLRACDLLAQATAWYLDTADRDAAALNLTTVRRLESDMAKNEHPDFTRRLASIKSSLLACTRTDGLVIWRPQEVWTAGPCPSDAQLRSLVEWLSATGHERVATDRLPMMYPAARAYAAQASGMVATRLCGGWLIWFRAEWPHSLTWAGRPDEPFRDSETGRISPRKSFASWRQKMRGRSAPWTDADRTAMDEVQALMLRAMMADQMRQLSENERILIDNERSLIEAKLSAESATRAKSEFLAQMSHEIRTPLNGVLGMTQVMAGDALTGDQRDRLRVIEKSGTGLLRILDDILDVSKIEAGRLDLEDIPFDITEVAADVFDAFEPLASAKGLGLVLDVSDDARGVWRGDPVRLRQLVSNLISNALKFTSEGQVSVTVDAAILDGARVMTLSVADTGIGVPPDVVSKLFDPFVQADSTTTRRFGGTGLGLTICRHITDLMGGEITVTSVVGEGTVFDVRLPLPWEGPTPEAPPPSPPAEDRPDISGLRVLAADDNATNRLVLQAVLKSLGVSAEIVDDGQRAVDEWAAGQFDMVLMDAQMPILDGVSATAEIRRIEAERGLRRTPIIAFTANAMRHQAAEYLAAGFDGHLAKPVVISDLCAVFERVVDPDARAAELPSGVDPVR
jgi:light-regulated signal transduction histidine kinase (bacteriophytochrome)/ActR/RegA family two-component response regulator